MLLSGGAVTFKTPLPAVKFTATKRCSMSNACVGAPGRTSTTEEILAASEVNTWKAVLYASIRPQAVHV